MRGVAPDGSGLDPVSRGRWVLAEHLGDAVDAAVLAGDSVAVSRLSLSVLRVLASLDRPARAGGVTSTDDDGEPRPVSIDEQYADLCAELGHSAES